jgi:hypothetical protein
MAQSRKYVRSVRPSAEQILPVYQELFSRPVVREMVQATGVRLRWCQYTPLVVLWGLVFQRLSDDHKADAVVAYLHAGGADGLDPDPRYPEPLSRRLVSESNSAYVQGRNRLPRAVVEGAADRVREWIAQQYTPQALTWHGRAVRVLDGTTFRLAATPELVKTYGRATNQHGASAWVVVKSVMALCLTTQTAVAHAEGPGTTSETALVRAVMAQDPVPDSVYIADRGFSGYRVLQIGRALGHPVIVRLRWRETRRLLKTIGRKRLPAGTECRVVWAPQPHNRLETDLPQPAIAGRLLHVRIRPPKARAFDVYLFTTLPAKACYSLDEVCALYARRWAGEIDYRHIKTTLEMDEFTVKSSALFEKELAAGLLSYNLICAWMVKAARLARLEPTDLSFAQCTRRVREFVRTGAPSWVESGQEETWLLKRLAKCRLPHQPNKVAHEPRKVRRRPEVYPALKGSRKQARRKLNSEPKQQH